MIVPLENKTIIVKFKKLYREYTPFSFKHERNIYKTLIDTECEIYRRIEGQKFVIGLGVAKQSTKDDYNKVLGKKIALGRALAFSDRLEPSEKYEIQEAFYQEFKHSK